MEARIVKDKKPPVRLSQSPEVLRLRDAAPPAGEARREVRPPSPAGVRTLRQETRTLTDDAARAKDTDGLPPLPPIKETQREAQLRELDETGDPELANELDPFRNRLTPEQQEEYDAMVQGLRDDPRVEFEYRQGAERSPMLEEMALRGIAASTFGDPQLLEDTIAGSAGVDGKLTLYMYPGEIPWQDFGIDREGSFTGGLATREGDIVLDMGFARGGIERGDNSWVHEFSHLTQRATPEGLQDRGPRFPYDFPFEEELDEAWTRPGFQRFLVDRFFGGNQPEDDRDEDGRPDPVHTRAELWPTLQNLFRNSPEDLREESPDIYRMMVDYSGHDPLTQERRPPVRRIASPVQAGRVLETNFAAIAGDDGRINANDLVGIRDSEDPSVTPEMRAAAAYLLQSDSARNFLDVGSGRGSVDDRITLQDLQGAAATLQEVGRGRTAGVEGEVDRLGEAAAILERYLHLADTAGGRGGDDRVFSLDDFEALRDDPGIPAEVRQALEYLHEHEEELEGLGGRDGRIGLGDLRDAQGG